MISMVPDEGIFSRWYTAREVRPAPFCLNQLTRQNGGTLWKQFGAECPMISA